MERTFADFPLVLDSTLLKEDDWRARHGKIYCWFLISTGLRPSEKKTTEELIMERTIADFSISTGLHPSEKKTTEELIMERTVADFPLVLDSTLLKEDDWRTCHGKNCCWFRFCTVLYCTPPFWKKTTEELVMERTAADSASVLYCTPPFWKEDDWRTRHGKNCCWFPLGTVVYLSWPIAPSYMSPNAGGVELPTGLHPFEQDDWRTHNGKNYY